MKTLTTILLAVLTQLTFAQCDKDFLLNFNEITEIRGTTNSAMKTEGIISFSKDKIIIKAIVKGGEKVITSNIRNADCKWDTFLKNGKTVYSLFSSKDSDSPKDEASLILEGVNGKLKVIFMPPNAKLEFQISQIQITE